MASSVQVYIDENQEITTKYIKHTFEKNILQAKSIQLFSHLYIFSVINGPRLKNEKFSV